MRLQNRQRVVDDETELFHVAFTFVSVSEVPCLTNTEGEVFCRARLNNVLGFEVGLVVLAVFAIQASVRAANWSFGAVDVPAFNVTGHEAQTWNAVLSHFQVITNLGRLLAWGVEVRVLDGVGEEDRVAAAVVLAHTDVVERSVTVNLLEGEGDGVCFHERESGCQGVSS